jgi:hypothetical protein
VERPTERRRLASAVADHDHVHGQQLHQPVQVAVAHGGEELPGQLVLLRSRHLEAGPAGLDVATGSSGDLSAVVLALVDHAGDLRVGEPEHVVEQKHRPFHGRQALEQDQERHRERVGHLGVLGQVMGLVRQHRLGQPLPDVLLAPHACRPQVVDGPAGHDRGQVRLGRLDRLAGHDRAVIPQVGVLDQVLSLAHAPDHPVGDREQERPELLVGLEIAGHEIHVMETREPLLP